MNGKPPVQNKYYRFYLIGFFIILALPLLTSSLLFNPPAWGKTILFRIILSTLIFFFIYQILYKKTDNKLSLIKNLLPFWLLAALLIVFLIATIFSLDPYYSFWESPLRAGGSLNFSFYIIFAILISLFIAKKEWQKIWSFTILIGVLVSIVAVFQQYNIFGKVIIPYLGRPPSTMGGPLFLALYLLLLVFITFSFFLKEKKKKKKLFYLLAVFLFLYVILITASRAAYFGLFIGVFYFIFSWSINLLPPKRRSLFLALKILAGIVLITTAFGIYYLNSEPELPEYLQKSVKFQEFSNRLSIRLVLKDPRFSSWKISFNILKEKPIIGHGPENFSIGFDKHYEPSLANINMAWGSWWDRAHNFLFDISTTAGIPALMIYLSLFASLFWGLQKIKKKRPEQALICHGIQATFLAYLSASFFGFDVFSTYIILFLLIGYSLYLISSDKTKAIQINPSDLQKPVSEKEANPIKPMLLSILFFILLWFIWSFNLKPLQVNKEINWADYYVKTNQCEKAIEKMEKDVLFSESIIDSYAKLKYIDIIGNCNKVIPGLKLALADKAISVLEEVTEIRPYYTRTWIFLGTYTNILIASNQGNVEELKKQAYYFFEKANQLSPKREQVFISWMQTDLIFREYEQTKEKAQKCIDLNPKSGYCWWIKGVSNLYLGEVEQGIRDIEMASKEKFDIYSEKHISELDTICEKIKNTKCFRKLANIYYTIRRRKIYKSDPEYSLHLVYISAMGESDKILKEYISTTLWGWPELESELRDNIKSASKYTSKINMEMVNQVIDKSKKITEVGAISKDLSKLELESKNCLLSRQKYINQIEAIKEDIAQIKLIKND